MSVNFYEILEIPETASPDEVKKSYQTLILKYHPDKQQKDGSSDSDRFILIDEAWKTLRDPELRKVYDSELLQKKFNETPIIFDTLRKENLSYDEENFEYFYMCRCGGVYIINENSNFTDCYISCDECSLVIKLIS